MAETDRRMAETDHRLKELGRQIGGLGNRLDEFVEGVVRPGLVRLFRERGIDVHQTLRGLFVVGQAGDDAVFLNSAGFEPRAW